MAAKDLEIRHSESLSKWALRCSSLVTFVLGWEIIGRTVDSLLLPTFSEMFPALVRLLGSAELWRAVWVSNQAMVLGFLLTATVGIPAGLLMGRWRAAERYLDVYLNILAGSDGERDQGLGR